MSDNTNDNPENHSDTHQEYDTEMANPPPVREFTAATADELKAGAVERAQQRPLLQKILSVFRKEKGSYRELIINSEPLEKRVALLVDGRLEKFEIERESDNRMVGGIFKGKIKNLDPGLKAAFVDIEQKMKSFVEEEIVEELHEEVNEEDTNHDENGQTTILSEDIKSEILKL
jgi:ribonuclease G